MSKENCKIHGNDNNFTIHFLYCKFKEIGLVWGWFYGEHRVRRLLFIDVIANECEAISLHRIDCHVAEFILSKVKVLLAMT